MDVSAVCLQFVIAVLPDHAHLLFSKATMGVGRYMYYFDSLMI